MAARSSNSLAILLLVLGKVCAIAGLIVAGWHRGLGGGLLVAAAGFIVSSVVIALRGSRQQVTEGRSDKEVVARLVREGALEGLLREIEDDKKAAASNDAVVSSR